MPTPSAYGILASAIHGGGGGGPSFVTATGYAAAGTTQVVSFSGASVGDLAIITTYSFGAVTISGWTALANFSWPSTGFVQSVLWKVLSSGDISTGSVTVTGLASGKAILFSAYRSVTSANLQTTGDVGSDGPLAVPGFTKSVGSKVIVTYMFLLAPAPVGTLVAPGLTTTRITTVTGGSSMAALADILPSSGYTNGTMLTWNGAPASTLEQVAQSVELT